MGFIDVTLLISDAVTPQQNYSTPLIIGEFEFDDNVSGPLATSVYWTDTLLIGGNVVRTMTFSSLSAVADIFLTTSTIYLAASAVFAQEITPDEVMVGQARAADSTRTASLTAIYDENSGFYFALDVDADNTEKAQIAAWIESNKKFYIFQTSDTDVYGSGSADIVSILGALNYTRTLGIYNGVAASYADAALAGRWGATEPGTETTKFMTLTGITAVNSTTLGVNKLTDTQMSNLDGKNCNYVNSSLAGDIFVEGAAVSGRFADVTRYADQLKYDLESEMALVLVNPANGAKVPYTQQGINQIKAAIVKILNRDILSGKLASYTKNDSQARPNTVNYEIVMPTISSISTSDKNARIYKTITVKVQYSSAIHKVEVNATMVV